MGTLSLAAIAAMACVSLVSYAVLDLVFSDTRRVSRRLQGLTDYERVQAQEAQPLLRPFLERAVAPAWAKLQDAVRVIWPSDYRSAIAQRLTRAGNPNGVDATRFLVAKTTLALGGLLGAGSYGAMSGTSWGTIVFLAIVLAVLGFFIPDLWLTAAVSSRQRAIVRELPDMLDMLTISVEAGLGFDAALSKLVKVNHGPLAREFGRAIQEVQAGSSRKEALRHLGERVDVTELSAFTTSIVQAEMFGVSISNVLRTQAAEMRLRRRQRAEEEAQKAPVKMVIPLVLCILPATLIVVGGPAVVKVMAVFG